MAQIKDKAPLKEFLTLISSEIVGAAQEIERRYPGVRVELPQHVIVRVMPRPEVDSAGKLTRILADVDEPADKFMEIPLDFHLHGEL